MNVTGFASISANHSLIVLITETMPGSGYLDQSEAGAGGARTNRSAARPAAAERREEQAPSPDSTQTRDPGEQMC